MIIESGSDIFKHIVTYYTIAIEEADTFVSWDFRRLRYTCLWIYKLKVAVLIKRLEVILTCIVKNPGLRSRSDCKAVETFATHLGH